MLGICRCHRGAAVIWIFAPALKCSRSARMRFSPIAAAGADACFAAARMVPGLLSNCRAPLKLIRKFWASICARPASGPSDSCGLLYVRVVAYLSNPRTGWIMSAEVASKIHSNLPRRGRPGFTAMLSKILFVFINIGSGPSLPSPCLVCFGKRCFGTGI